MAGTAAREIADDVEDTTPEEPSLRDQIEDARDEYLAEHELENRGEAPAGAEARTDRTRDEHGRFIPRDQRAADPAAATTQQQPAAGQQSAPQGQPQAGATGQNPAAPNGLENNALVAPNSWTPAAKAEWAALPAGIKAEITRREQDVARTLTRHDEERQLGNAFNQVYQQNLDFFQRAQVHPLKLMNDYIGISKILGGSDINAKAQLIYHAARTNGIDLQALARMQPGGQAQRAGAPGQPPQPAQVSQQVALPPVVQQALSRIDAFEQNQQRIAQETEQRQQQETYEEIVSFRSQPESRFFDAVKDHMVALLESGATSNLKDAYDAAIWARPDIRTILLNEQKAAAASAQNRARKVSTARDRGSSVRGGSGSMQQSTPADRTLREELQHNLAEAQRARV